MTGQNPCILCKSTNFNRVLDLGSPYMSGFTSDIKLFKEKFKRAPLALDKCANPNCGFVQVSEFQKPDDMYREYWYRSGVNPSMVAALRDIIDEAQKHRELRPSDCVVDIGCNDGTLLSMYPEHVYKVGFDPANNLKELAAPRCDEFHNDYFSADLFFESANTMASSATSAAIVTSIAMFYDLQKPGSFIADVKKILKEDGIWVIQMTDLTSMLHRRAFDNVCHEHIAYYTLKLLRELLEDYGMSVFDVAYNKVNGGSVRLYVSHAGAYKEHESVKQALHYEEEVHEQFPVESFQAYVDGLKLELNTLVDELKSTKKVIFGMGASTKGNTLLQYFGLDETRITCIMEVTKEKLGLFTVGSNIPIISEEEGMKIHPDYVLLLPWHFAEGIINKHQEYLQSGGKFIVPMPKLEVVGAL